jgi:hypothetical protein
MLGPSYELELAYKLAENHGRALPLSRRSDTTSQDSGPTDWTIVRGIPCPAGKPRPQFQFDHNFVAPQL